MEGDLPGRDERGRFVSSRSDLNLPSNYDSASAADRLPNYGAFRPLGELKATMTPGEKALAVAKFPAQATVDAAGDLGTLPIRAREAADVYAATGQYDPAPFVETAMNTMGGTAFSAPAGAMGAGPVMRKSLLDMGQEARMGRAQAQGF